MPPGTVNETDAFALAMVLILTLGLGVVAMLAIGIYRSGKRRTSEAEELLDELRRDEADGECAAAPGKGEAPAPWEKRADWWKTR